MADALRPRIPPPPPLPPSKTSYFSRFVTSAYSASSRPSSAQASRPVPRLSAGYTRPGLSQDASHKTGLDISALDINRQRTHAILAGKEILKTVRVQDAKIVEETNLRAAVINYAEHHPAAGSLARQREGLGIHDVKWSHSNFDTHIATAATNGKIILYDLNRAGVELARLHEHTRQVHRLAFNPHSGSLLLSASHDTTARFWDLRDMRKDVMTCTSRQQFQGMNSGIRDVRWSLSEGTEFAFGTDNGTIQRWDMRNTKGPKQKITAHDQRTCTSIDWHPDGKHLLSAGVDKTVKVWDFSLDGRRQKPVYVLHTPYPVHNARWRSSPFPDSVNEKADCTQIATAYDRDHSVVHIWDFRRPYLPFREINKYTTAAADMLWHSRDILWTVGRQGMFQQNDVHFAPKVVDHRNLQAIAVSPSGEMAGFAQRRPRRQRSGSDFPDDEYMSEKRSSPEKTSLISSADDSLDDSFLSSSLRKHHGRTTSSRSVKSYGSTPPTSTNTNNAISLTDSMALHEDSSKPHQLAFRGPVPGTASVQVFAYLAQKYKAIPLPDPPTLQSFLDLQSVFDQNAEYAQRAAFYRLSETWKIVGASIAVAAKRRAELHRRQRRHEYTHTTVASSNVRQTLSDHMTAHDKQTSLLPNPAVRAILGLAEKPQSPQRTFEAPPIRESTSNLATPLARPHPSGHSATATDSHGLPRLPDPDHEDAIRLPPALTGPPQSVAQTSLAPGHAHRFLAPGHAGFNGPHWYNPSDDLDERRALIGSWRVQPRTPLSLEPADTQGIDIKRPPRLDRHDSDESFAMFSASTDSQRGISMPSSFASGKSHSQGMASIPEKWQHGPADSSFGKPRLLTADHAADQHAPEIDSLGKSIQISPTTVPIGRDLPGVEVPMGRRGQQGSARDDMDPSVEFNSRERAVQDIEILRRNNQLLRHDSSESEAYTASRGEVSASSMDYSVDMEASGTIVPDSAPPVLDPAAESPLLLSDFQAMHIDAEEGSAFAVIGLLKNILAFHTTSLSDAQTASVLLLLLAPLLPRTRNPSTAYDPDITETLSNFSETLTALGLTQTQAKTVLSTQLTDLLATGINPYQAEAILYTYHAQLHSLSLFNPAASLRRLAYPTYPAVYEQALKDTELGLLCLSCKSPINNPKDKMRCETCKRAQAPCPICWGRYPAFEPASAKKKAKSRLRSSLKDKDHRRKRSSLLSNQAFEAPDANDVPSPSTPERPSPPKATLWTWCPLCGHGGHTNCLSTWFADPVLSDGACATEGCLCDCVRGERREGKIRELLRKKAEKEKTKIVRKGDDWKVQESKAVSAVRERLGEAVPPSQTSNQPATAGNAPNALNAARKEDGKRVRVVVPKDEQPQSAPQSQAPYLSQDPSRSRRESRY
ncbi:hypothetical protein P154DRAFT_482191 [Amniculicola lignicola CBS 123094]|uniref:Uncharacterized protein n=1 Tax=Amniculicola lignicola CBS 123094 TaxID=1392246 RepID=A0A6A5WX29_9PLEO|nr:hypothetical protein P154DRAFT_482191 [Amniculicola lignicola CBS 123094]